MDGVSTRTGGVAIEELVRQDIFRPEKDCYQSYVFMKFEEDRKWMLSMDEMVAWPATADGGR